MKHVPLHVKMKLSFMIFMVIFTGDLNKKKSI